jgi:ankyrin repeat protein
VSGSLPERPDAGQLRRQAKELRDAARQGDAAAMERLARHLVTAPGSAVRLSAAQLVIARELGFASWPRLIAAVEAGPASGRLVLELVSASVEGRLRRAREIVRADPEIAGRSLLAASVLGDAGAVREHLAADPAAAVAVDNGRGWPPLLYACYSRWHQIDPGRAPGLAEVARLLLEGGASADTNDGGRVRFRSALKGAVDVNNPQVTEVLLAAGANPDLGQPIGEAAGYRDRRCLRLLLSGGARVAGTWALGAAVGHDDPDAVTMLLDALAAGGGQVADAATEVLPDAAAAASFAVVAALLDAGADPRASDGDGVSVLRLAVRAGKEETAARLRAFGAADDSTDVDRFLGACLNADRPTAERLLTGQPDLRDRLTDQDRAVICEAAAAGPAGALALMLDLGFSPRARRFGEQPLHAAAYHGNTPAVRLLLAAGAEVDTRDERFGATPLAFATVGSGERAGQPGDWTGTVRLLIEAGASRQDVWITDKPPGEDVADLLRQYGITPAGQAGEPGDQDSDQTSALEPDGTGVMAEIARHLETACRDLDLDLLGSLLHPEVRWTGLCHGKAQVLDWYRARLAEGTTVAVRSVETGPDAVEIGLTVTGRAEGARPAPPQQIYQVFVVEDAQITEIHGYDGSGSERTGSIECCR